MTRVRRAAATGGWILSFLLLAAAGHASDDGADLKKAWKRTGSTIKEAATETGHAFRDVAKTASHTVKQAAKRADDSTREAREEAGAEGKSFWGKAKQGLANALDEFSDALSRLMADIDD